MLLLEHDAKEILTQAGILVPTGVLISNADRSSELPVKFPNFVKAQIPTGGRKKIGGVIRTKNRFELNSALRALLDMELKGHLVRECRVEEIISGKEAYISLSINPILNAVNVLVSDAGGIDIESSKHKNNVGSGYCERSEQFIFETIDKLTVDFPPRMRSAINDVGLIIAKLFCEIEATLIEINPLMVLDSGEGIACDAKIILDENAFVRQPGIVELIQKRSAAYSESVIKIESQFDYIEINPKGDVGLITTGAGLSMQIVDELLHLGVKPLNFCDIRTGTFRGNPDRLIWVMRKMSQATCLKSVLVNIFAGVTNLGELAELLLQARRVVPELAAPFVVRLVGSGEEQARRTLSPLGHEFELVTDLEEAICSVISRSQNSK